MKGYVIIIADIIKKLRLNKGYTQKEVADLLGISRSTYCCYEIGRISPDLNTIRKLSEIFNVHYTELLEPEGNNYFNGGDRLSDYNDCDNKYSYNQNFQFGNLSDEEKYFVVAFRLLPEDSRKEVMTIIINKFKERNNRGDLNSND